MHFVAADDFEGLFAVAGLQGLESPISQDAGHRLAKVAIVVGDQESWSEEGHFSTCGYGFGRLVSRSS